MRIAELLLPLAALLPLFVQEAPPPPATDAPPAPAALSATERAAVARRLAVQVDDALEAAWRAEGIEPAPTTDDATWLRRLSLDLRGTIPRAEEAASFLADARPDRRERKIDEYLADPSYGAYQARRWTEALLADGGSNGERMEGMLIPWLADQFSAGVPFPETVRSLITASGLAVESSPGAFVLTYHDSIETLTGVTAKVLLGLQIQCAQCHDHPSDHWKQEQFNRFAAFFSGVHGNYVPRKGRGGPVTFKLEDRGPAAELLAALRRLEKRAGSSSEEAMAAGEAMGGAMRGAMAEADDAVEEEAPGALAPMASAGAMAAMEEGAAESAWSLEQAAALTELIGRCKAAPAGRDPLAELEADAPAFAALMEQLPADARVLVDEYTERRDKFGVAQYLDGAPFVAEGKSRRVALADWMVDPKNPWFATAIVNRLFAQLFGKGLVEPIDDLSAATDRIVPELLQALANEFMASGGDVRLLLGALVRTGAYARGNSPLEGVVARERQERWFAAHPVRSMDADQLTDSLRRVLGRDATARNDRRGGKEREELLEEVQRCYGREPAGVRANWIARIPQALFLMNGALANTPDVKARPRIVRDLDAAGSPPRARVNTLFLTLLGRPAEEAEAEAIVAQLAAAQTRGVAAYEDLVWALLNTTEFRANR
ncbi:MAG: DUF1549 domain-containing protein [Planctomycetes bacterium]|nr:DUF1549 domain-containing protein [Planctomycetota bacterium]